MTLDLLKVAAGLLLLWAGGDALIRGAVGLARRRSVSVQALRRDARVMLAASAAYVGFGVV